MYTAFWRSELPDVSKRWPLGSLFLTAEAMAGPENAVRLQFEEIMALMGRGFKLSSAEKLTADQLFAMRPLQEKWCCLRRICFNDSCSSWPGSYVGCRCSRCRRAVYCSEQCHKVYVHDLYKQSNF